MSRLAVRGKEGRVSQRRASQLKRDPTPHKAIKGGTLELCALPKVHLSLVEVIGSNDEVVYAWLDPGPGLMVKLDAYEHVLWYET